MSEVRAWEKMPTDFELSVLDRVAGDGVQVSCVNSSDFVVGRQTNFNGPVTIINCTDSSILGESSQVLQKKEEIVIRDKVLSESASEEMQKIANGKSTSKKIPKCTWVKYAICLPPLPIYFRFDNFLGILLAGILACALMALIVFGCIFFLKPDVADKGLVKCLSYVKPTGNNICIYGLKGDKEEDLNEPTKTMMGPLPYVLISQTNRSFCFDYKTCVKSIEALKENPEKEEKNSTNCNFFVGGDGSIFEDGGWNASSTFTGPAADKTVEICLIGNSVDYPTYPQMKSAKNLIRFGSANRFLAKNYVLMAPNATSTSPERTLSPIVYGIIKKWPKFSEFPFLLDESQIFREDYPIIGKKDWGGRPATSAIEMKMPVPYVVLSHSVTVPCSGLDFCSNLLQGVQNYHMSLKFADIAYNFMVDSDGVIYEGRGWSRRNVAGSFINGRNVDINFIGDFSKSASPTPNQFNGVKYLISEGLKSGKIAANYSLIAANATYSTLSPGKNVYEVIKNWPHFDPDPEAHVKEYDDA